MDAAWSNFLFQVGWFWLPPYWLLALGVVWWTCNFHMWHFCPQRILNVCLSMVMALCSFLQNTPTPNQVEGSLQSELMPVHTSSPQTPPTEHMAQPPSTVDTAALNEDPLPGEGHCMHCLPVEILGVKCVKQGCLCLKKRRTQIVFHSHFDDLNFRSDKSGENEHLASSLWSDTPC